jgi:hypothetical protein
MRLFLPIIVLAILAAPALALTAPACAPGPPDPREPFYASLRPASTARCVYALADFQRRIDRMATVRSGTLSVETVEALFGLPPMTTSYDDPTRAAYEIRLEGAGGWEAYIWVTEFFYGRAPQFAGTIRPRRLHPERRGVIEVTVLLSRPNPRLPENAASCRSAGDFVRVLRRAGWTDPPFVGMATDGVQPAQGFVRAGGLGLSLGGVPHQGPYYSQEELDGACLGQFSLGRGERKVAVGGAQSGKTAKPRSPH